MTVANQCIQKAPSPFRSPIVVYYMFFPLFDRRSLLIRRSLRLGGGEQRSLSTPRATRRVRKGVDIPLLERKRLKIKENMHRAGGGGSNMSIINRGDAWLMLKGEMPACHCLPLVTVLFFWYCTLDLWPELPQNHHRCLLLLFLQIKYSTHSGPRHPLPKMAQAPGRAKPMFEIHPPPPPNSDTHCGSRVTCVSVNSGGQGGCCWWGHTAPPPPKTQGPVCSFKTNKQ